jgi:hypothetical protein
MIGADYAPNAKGCSKSIPPARKQRHGGSVSPPDRIGRLLSGPDECPVLGERAAIVYRSLRSARRADHCAPGPIPSAARCSPLAHSSRAAPRRRHRSSCGNQRETGEHRWHTGQHCGHRSWTGDLPGSHAKGGRGRAGWHDDAGRNLRCGRCVAGQGNDHAPEGCTSPGDSASTGLIRSGRHESAAYRRPPSP